MKKKHEFIFFCLFIAFLMLAPVPSSGEQVHPASPREEAGLPDGGSGFREDELLVRFSRGTGKEGKEAAIRRRGFKKIKEFPFLNLYHVKIRPHQTVEAAREEIRSEPGVLYAEPNFVVTTQLVPNDPRFPGLWGLRNTGQSGGTVSADIDAPAGWDIQVGGGNAVVAVLDTGIDYDHPDLAANIWVNPAEFNGLPGVDDDGNGYVDDLHGIDTIHHDSDPQDDNDHGTHVAGTIGAVGNNGIGVVGVNWSVGLMACKFIGADGSGSIADAIECLEYVRTMRSRGVNVVATNNSYGTGEYSQALADAIDAQREILFVAAAGNGAQDNDRFPIFPAGYFLPNVLSVAATDPDDGIAYFSNYGRQTVQVGAPGVEILSTLRNGGYGPLSGTSMAAPHATGLAALLKSQYPSVDGAGIRNLILAGGESVPSAAGTTVTGRRINAYGSLSCNDRSLLAAYKYSFDVGGTSVLSAFSIDCASPLGPVTAVASTGEAIPLRDDGVSPDLSAGDGIFTASWTPAAEPAWITFSSPAGTQTVEPPRLSDLAVVSVSAPPSVNTGDRIHVTAAVKNEGNREAGLFLVGFYLSADPFVTTADLYLGSAVVFLLGPGADRSVSVDAAIPANLSSGTYFIGAVADYGNLVDESDESNNALAGNPVAVTRVYPDLVMSSVAGPSTAATGQQIVVAGTVTNQGPLAAGAQYVGFYLSTDGQITTKDIFLGNKYVPSLGPGTAQTVSVTGTVPSNLPGGTYSIGAVADYVNIVAESDEGNNSSAGNPVAVTRLYPDLAVASVSGPAAALTGQPFPVSVTVRNLGQASAPSSYLYVYLSGDGAITTADTRIGYVYLGALAPGGEQTVTLTATIPATLASGTYYLGAITDPFSLVPESNESNNALAGNPIAVTRLYPDLTVVSVSGPATALSGQPFPVSVTVRNQGQASAASTYLSVYLSQDGAITIADTRIGYVFMGPLPPGAEQTFAVNATVPAYIASGTYRLGAVADPYSMVPESDEGNNALAGNTLLLGPGN